MAKKNKNKKNKDNSQVENTSSENNSLPVYESSAQRDDNFANERRSMPLWQRILIVLIILLLLAFGWWIFFSNSNNNNSNNSDSNNSEQTSNNNSSSENSSTPTPTNSSSTTTPTPTPTATATTTPTPTPTGSTSTSTSASTAATTSGYTYTAVRGDSLTRLVRKSMLDYLSKNKVNLNNNQKVYVEANLVKQYGNKRLKVGQKVAILNSDLKNWSDKASKLSASQQAKYAKFAARIRY